METKLEIARYNLFMRNWKAGSATAEIIDKAVIKGFITAKQGEIIKKTERNPS